jgi:hypothetical protein
MMKNEKAEMLGHWLGDADFFFCHLYTEDKDAIIDTLDKVGFNSLMNTLPNKMSIFVSSEKLTDMTMAEIVNSKEPTLSQYSDNNGTQRGPQHSDEG